MIDVFFEHISKMATVLTWQNSQSFFVHTKYLIVCSMHNDTEQHTSNQKNSYFVVIMPRYYVSQCQSVSQS